MEVHIACQGYHLYSWLRKMKYVLNIFNFYFCKEHFTQRLIPCFLASQVSISFWIHLHRGPFIQMKMADTNSDIHQHVGAKQVIVSMHHFYSVDCPISISFFNHLFPTCRHASDLLHICKVLILVKAACTCHSQFKWGNNIEVMGALQQE